MTDSDQDGLPDAWEVHFGLDPNSSADASLDSDGDGIGNLREFATETNPRDINSGLRFTMISTTSNSLRLSWQTEAGKTYQIQAATNIATGPWQGLGLPMREGSYNEALSVTSTPFRFYRLKRVD